MKRTTYIFIGVFSANVILAVILLVYLRGVMMNSEDINYGFSFEQQQSKSLDLEDVHTLEFTTIGADADQFYFTNPGKVEITASGVPSKQMLSYHTSDYLKVNKEDGVLRVVVDLTSGNLKADNSGIGRGISLDNLTMNIETGNMLKRVSSDKGFNIKIQQTDIDSLYITSKSVYMKSCEIQSLVLDNNMNFKAENSNFNDLHIDLDQMRWEILESKVNTLYLTGSGKRPFRLSDDQYGKLVWEPKDENAELNVTLKGKAEIVTGN